MQVKLRASSLRYAHALLVDSHETAAERTPRQEMLGAPGLERAVMDQLKAVAGEERPWEQVRARGVRTPLPTILMSLENVAWHQTKLAE